MAPRLVNHFALLRFTPAFVGAPRETRQAMLEPLHAGLPEICQRFYLYQIFPARHDIDLLLWTVTTLDEPQRPAVFLERLGHILLHWRPFLETVGTLWGYTRPSVYARGKSPQELDPLQGDRKRYLIAYPFVKTADWYLLRQDTRQGMMNEHIKVGRQYPEIRQLLLYSFGLQDQEFVVVYETDDLVQFSDLVYDLRATEARRYTLRDTPILTGFYAEPAELLTRFIEEGHR